MEVDILNILNKNYPICFDRLELLRDVGSRAYVVYTSKQKYFLRIIKPAFFDTAFNAINIQLFLQERGFNVPPIIINKFNTPYIKNENGIFVLYEYIEGVESDPEQDAEAIGALLGKLHCLMKEYPSELIKREKYYYIDKYIDILRKKQYKKADEFFTYGEMLWEKVKDLPRGYCHGDMYSGNIHKTPNGELYVLDFDTSCEGFPMYDPVLICNRTHYFDFDECGYEKSKSVFSRFLPEYQKYNSLSQMEINSFYDMIALYHFALQAMVIENFGLDCVDNEFFDKQLDWLYKWREQVDSKSII